MSTPVATTSDGLSAPPTRRISSAQPRPVPISSAASPGTTASQRRNVCAQTPQRQSPMLGKQFTAGRPSETPASPASRKAAKESHEAHAEQPRPIESRSSLSQGRILVRSLLMDSIPSSRLIPRKCQLQLSRFDERLTSVLQRRPHSNPHYQRYQNRPSRVHFAANHACCRHEKGQQCANCRSRSQILTVVLHQLHSFPMLPSRMQEISFHQRHVWCSILLRQGPKEC